MKRTPTYSPLLLNRIKHAAGLGHTAEEMAKRFKRDDESIRDICRQHGIAVSGVASPAKVSVARQSTVCIRLETESLTAFSIEAERRGTSTPQLVGEILNLVAKDGLFAAVLD